MSPYKFLSSQQSAERAAHDGATDRTADRAPDRLAEVGSNPADPLIGNRSSDVAGDDLAGRQPATRRAGAQNPADDHADLPQYSAASTVRPCHPLLQDFVGGFAINRGVVFPLHRAVVDDGFAFFRRDRPDPRGRGPNPDA